MDARKSLKLIFLTVITGIFMLLAQTGYAEEKHYIYELDLTVVETFEGEIRIAKIGRYSPFRRYSSLRVGDIIEKVDGKKITVFGLYALSQPREPWIQYSREGYVVRHQISLQKPVFGYPDYLDQVSSTK